MHTASAPVGAGKKVRAGGQQATATSVSSAPARLLVARVDPARPHWRPNRPAVAPASSGTGRQRGLAAELPRAEGKGQRTACGTSGAGCSYAQSSLASLPIETPSNWRATRSPVRAWLHRYASGEAWLTVR